MSDYALVKALGLFDDDEESRRIIPSFWVQGKGKEAFMPLSGLEEKSKAKAFFKQTWPIIPIQVLSTHVDSFILIILFRCIYFSLCEFVALF